MTVKTGRLESREEAIRRLGSHWEIGPRLGDADGAKLSIRQCLGSEDGHSGYRFSGQRRGEATAAALERLRVTAGEDYERASEILGSYRSRLAIWRAKHGLYPADRVEIVNANVERLTGERDKARETLDDIAERSDWRLVDAVMLPETMHVPAAVEIGDTVWEVGYEWPLDGFRFCETRVVGMSVYEGRDDSPYDVTVSYRTKRLVEATHAPSDLGFECQHDTKAGSGNLVAANQNSALYFDRDEALGHLEAIKQKIRDNMDRVP